jgi:hypothetical protein
VNLANVLQLSWTIEKRGETKSEQETNNAQSCANLRVIVRCLRCELMNYPSISSKHELERALDVVGCDSFELDGRSSSFNFQDATTYCCANSYILYK